MTPLGEVLELEPRPETGRELFSKRLVWIQRFSSSLGASARTPTRPNWKPRRGDAAHEATLRHRGNKTTRLTSAARDDRVCAHHAHVMGARATSKISAGRTLSQPQTEAASIPGIVREQGSWCGAATALPSAVAASHSIRVLLEAAQKPRIVDSGLDMRENTLLIKWGL